MIQDRTGKLSEEDMEMLFHFYRVHCGRRGPLELWILENTDFGWRSCFEGVQGNSQSVVLHCIHIFPQAVLLPIIN